MQPTALNMITDAHSAKKDYCIFCQILVFFPVGCLTWMGFFTEPCPNSCPPSSGYGVWGNLAVLVGSRWSAQEAEWSLCHSMRFSLISSCFYGSLFLSLCISLFRPWHSSCDLFCHCVQVWRKRLACKYLGSLHVGIYNVDRVRWTNIKSPMSQN